MKISVVIPCHNSSAFLAAALDSVANQTLAAYEVIVVDDQSSDDSAQIAMDHRLKPTLLKVSYGNAAPTRNAGIEVATGDWVAFLDADNIWFPDHLATGKAMLEQGGDALFVAAPALETEEPPTEFGQKLPKYAIDKPKIGLTQEDFVRWRLKKTWGFPTTGTIANLKAVRSVGGFDATQKRRHDFELVMRVIAGKTWCATPVATWWSRPIREGNISANKPACAYYAYRALHLNRQQYDSEAYRTLLRNAALNAIKNAVYSRDPDLRRDAMGLAWQELGIREKMKVAVFTMTPPMFRSKLIRQ